MNKVLLVDDDPRLIRALRLQLEDHDFEVEFAISGAEAEAILKYQEFDAIICDNRMCGMRGIRVLANASRNYPDMARFMLTGGDLTRSDLVLLEKEIGVAGLFSKPYDPEALIQRLDEVLNTD